MHKLKKMGYLREPKVTYFLRYHKHFLTFVGKCYTISQFLVFIYECFLIFLHNEDNKSLFFSRHVMTSLMVFVVFFMAKITNLYCYDITNEVTFRKICFFCITFQFFSIYIATVTVYAKTYYCCWFEIAETPKVIYYSCMASSNDVIGIYDDITL